MDKKERRLEAKLSYWTSSLTVSAILAAFLTLLIAILLFMHHQDSKSPDVPDQLWTVYTAVVAFYFGRGASGVRTTLDTLVG